MLKVRTLLATFSLLLFAVLVHAQRTVTSVQAAQGAGTGSGSGAGVIGGTVETFPMPSGTPGHPFSADVIEENDKFLADGNRLHHENHGRTFRDSQGRTRTETEAGSFGPENKPLVFVTIMDIVEGRMIRLNLEKKTATISRFRGGFLNRSVDAANAPVSKPVQPLAATTGAPAEQGKNMALRERLPEDLGTKEIEGFIVSGSRFTTTIPAGKIGNDKPLTTVSERWFSFDLKMDLFNSSESPAGKHVHRLVNIHAGDPDPLLFQVPSDFTVKETQQE